MNIHAVNLVLLVSAVGILVAACIHIMAGEFILGLMFGMTAIIIAMWTTVDEIRRDVGHIREVVAILEDEPPTIGDVLEIPQIFEDPGIVPEPPTDGDFVDPMERAVADARAGRMKPIDISPTAGDAFVSHIEGHLQPGEYVICKICGRTAASIATDPPAVGDVVDPMDIGPAGRCFSCIHSETTLDKHCVGCGFDNGWPNYQKEEPPTGGDFALDSLAAIDLVGTPGDPAFGKDVDS